MGNMRHLLLVFNIPPTLHVSDLRSFFSSAIESEKFFKCFHFRHRPQKEFVRELKINFPLQDGSKTSTISRTSIFSKALVEDAVCAVVECMGADSKTLFLKRYHFENWVTGAGAIMLARCIIADIVLDNEEISLPLDALQVSNSKILFYMPTEKCKNMVEFSPPMMMPKGNVGTPTQHFKDLIRRCQLPSKMIKKLGLNFPRQKARRYGHVPYDYGTNQTSITRNSESNDFVQHDDARPPTSLPRQAEEPAADEEEEEWDRHENLHEDVDQQSRTKERLYEEEMEVVWEKGGPGLVWYTDAQYWQQQEGDFDEETSDDWDVDYSVYFEENGGDKDARDALEMRRSDQWRVKGSDSVFSQKKIVNQANRRLKPHCKMKAPLLGSFEVHTRGIGRRLLEKQGWRDGMGLGRSTKGIPEALEADGQKPRERKGLGYYGEALIRRNTVVGHPSRSGVCISTVYDDRLKSDPPEPLLMRRPATQMKYRQNQ